MILSNKFKKVMAKVMRPIRGVATSIWHYEDLCSSKWDEDDADFISSGQYQEQALDLSRKTLRSLVPQQQESIGFRFPGYATQTGAASIYWASSWNAATTYPAGNGKVALYNSYLQFQGVIYNVPGTVASTPGTPPPGGVWVVAQPNAPQWIGANPGFMQSVFATPTGDFPSPAPGTVKAVDSTWDIPETQVLSANATYYYYPAPGVGYIVSSATFGQIQINIAGTFTSVFPLTAASWSWFAFDGISTRLLCGATLNTVTLYRILQLIM